MSEPFVDFTIGLDLGKRRDYTALAILEGRGPAGSGSLDCTHLERFPLGTPYPKIVDAVRELVARPQLRPWRRHPRSFDGSIRSEPAPPPTLVIDAGGVGEAVVDLFLTASIDAHLIPLKITGGGQARWDRWDSTGHACCFVPKLELVGVVQAILQTGRLKVVPSLEYADTLKRELLEFEVTVTASANETFNAREGQHDDIVLALAMAAWVLERRPPPDELGTCESPLRLMEAWWR